MMGITSSLIGDVFSKEHKRIFHEHIGEVLCKKVIYACIVYKTHSIRYLNAYLYITMSCIKKEKLSQPRFALGSPDY